MAGAWVLPSISADVPLELTRGASATAFNGSVFALEAHAAGVRLPAGDFTTVKETLRQQLTAYVSKHCDPQEPVKLDFLLDVEEDKIKLILHAQDSLKVVELRGLIERLEAFAKGLGWFVYDAISKAGDKYPIYDDSALRYFCELLWFDPSLSDTEYAEEQLEMNGEERNGRTDNEVIEEFTAGYRPSHLQETYIGNEWMLGSHIFRDGQRVQVKKPRPMTLRAVNRLLQLDMPANLRQVVIDALALREQVMRKSQMVHSSKHGPEGSDEYQGMPYGASCIAVWKWTMFASELIGHFEEYEMNGGESDTVHMHFTADPSDAESVKKLVRAFKDVVAWHSAVGRLLKHFDKPKTTKG